MKTITTTEVEEIKGVFNQEGIELVDITVEDVVEYLSNSPADYSIYNWIDDTKTNYPECFK